MQITLNQSEIEAAIIAFVGNQGISIIGKKTDVTLIAGRAPNGMSASIEISDSGVPTNTPINRKIMPHEATTIVEVSDTQEATEGLPEETEESVGQKSLFGA